MQFETIESNRLILKKTTPEILNFIFTNHDEHEIESILGIPSEKAFQKEKAKFESGYTTFNRSFENFLMFEKHVEQIIGSCGFHTWIMDHNRAEIGYAIYDDTFKNKGYMTEALGLVLNHGFEKMQLNRIEAYVSPNNFPSLSLLTRFNFIEEGTLKRHYFTNGIYEDSILLAKLAESNFN